MSGSSPRSSDGDSNERSSIGISDRSTLSSISVNFDIGYKKEEDGGSLFCQKCWCGSMGEEKLLTDSAHEQCALNSYILARNPTTSGSSASLLGRFLRDLAVERSIAERVSNGRFEPEVRRQVVEEATQILCDELAESAEWCTYERLFLSHQ